MKAFEWHSRKPFQYLIQSCPPFSFPTKRLERGVQFSIYPFRNIYFQKKHCELSELPRSLCEFGSKYLDDVN